MSIFKKLALHAKFLLENLHLGKQHQNDISKLAKDQASENSKDAIPKHNALFYEGNALVEQQKFTAAIACYEAAIQIKPDFASAYSNRGAAFLGLQNFALALENFNTAIRIKPDHVDAHNNRGFAHQLLGELDTAIINFDKAIEIQSDYAQAHWNKSLALLLTGDYLNGWALHEWRWKNKSLGLNQQQFPRPLWLGKESIKDKTIFLHFEQGFGDTIQLVRYAKLAADRGARVIFGVPKELVGLFQGVKGVSEWVVSGDELPDFDFHCPIFSLPLAFKTELATIPSSHAYLQSDKRKVEEWSKKLGIKTKPRTGLVWSGLQAHKNDSSRSIALSSLIGSLPPEFDYVSLQKDVRDADQATLKANPHIKHFGEALVDFTDTAALCDLMDIVISVDTSVAHMSGALGKTTWVLLPYIPDWRWMLDRDDSPWYQSVKLYRQTSDRSWSSVLDKVCLDLIAFSSNADSVRSP